MDADNIKSILSNKCGLVCVKPVLVGVSGGPDSLCLLDLLVKAGIPVVVGHVNHGLRAEAEAESLRVAQLCRGYQVPFECHRADVRTIAQKAHQSIEEAARKVRYQFLFQLAVAHNAQAVLVAHNQDDQAETILMHFLRGSGMKGLRGMDYRHLPNEWSNIIPLVRPLLDVPRSEILAYCRENHLEPAFDETNNDTTYFRNRLRQELVPYLETYTPNIRQRLATMADVVRQEDEYLEEVGSSAISRFVNASGAGYFVMNKEEMCNLHPAITRRVLYTLMKKLNPETPNFAFGIIDAAAKFALAPSKSGQMELAGGLEISGYLRDSILLADNRQFPDGLWPKVQKSERLHLSVGDAIRLNGNWCLRVSEAGMPGKGNPWEACLDAAKAINLHLDHFSPGDRFSPLGMGGKSVKLGDFWTNEGLPRRARAAWPLVRSGDEVVWIPGFAINENYKITEDTRSRVSIHLFKS